MLASTIVVTPLSISALGVVPSCQGGHSGVASVVATGSDMKYTYLWLNASGQTVGNQQTVTGLAPGTYSVYANSKNCGNPVAGVMGSVEVKTTVPSAYTSLRSFCDTTAYIRGDKGGVSYQWYDLRGAGSKTIPAPDGVKDVLFVSYAKPGDVYALVYKDQQGCKDSTRYILKKSIGADIYVTNLLGICKDSTSGATTLNVYSPEPGTLSYQVTGPQGYTRQDTLTGNTQSFTGLVKGTYKLIIQDAACRYASSFSIPSVVNFTASPTNGVYCSHGPTVANLNFAPVLAASCYTTSLSAPVANKYQLHIPTGISNDTTTLPGPYTHAYHYSRQQYLVQKTDLNVLGIQGGVIASLAFKIRNLNGDTSNYRNFRVRLACTGLSTLSNNTFENSGLQEVYFKDTVPIRFGWNTYVFQQKFVWNGTDNILVDICQGSADLTKGNASVELVQMPYHASNWSLDNALALCQATVATNTNPFLSNANNYLPNMRFGYGKVGADTNYVITATPGPYTLSANHQQIIFPGPGGPIHGSSSKQYTVTVTDQNGCLKDTTVTFVYADPNAQTGTTQDTIICSGKPFTLMASNANAYTWLERVDTKLIPLWDTTMVHWDTTKLNLNLSPGVHFFYLKTSAYCRPDGLDSVKVTVYPSTAPALSINTDGIICQTKTNTLFAQLQQPANSGLPNYFYTYAWTNDQGKPLSGINDQPLYTLSDPTIASTYVITVSGPCINPVQEKLFVTVEPCALKIPNVITPNSDGKNDQFFIENLGQHPNSQLMIFDRWGRLVYETDNYQNNWTGDGVSDGTFFYVLKTPDDSKNYQGYLTVFHGQ